MAQNCSTGDEDITEFVVDSACLTADPPVHLISFAIVTDTISQPTHPVTASSGKNVKAIIGGTLVGVLGLLMIIFAVWGFIVWRRRATMRMIVLTPGKAGSLYEE